MSVRTTVLVVGLAGLLGACGGDAHVGGDGTATGGDGVRGNVSPTISPAVTVGSPGATTSSDGKCGTKTTKPCN